MVKRYDGKDPEALVKEFHEVYGMPDLLEEEESATLDIGDRLHMRMSLILEEVTELVEAVYGVESAALLEGILEEILETDRENRDLVETADALADLVYVIYGMALETGISLPSVLGEVQRSNMSKLMPDGSVRRREDGKILKGPNFSEPDIAFALKR